MAEKISNSVKTSKYPAFQSRNFRLFFFGQIASLAGTFMTQVAIIWLIYELSGSSTVLGLAGFLTTLPTFAIAPFSGAISDRWDRRRILIVLQWVLMACSLALVFITFFNLTNIWLLLIFGTLIGIGRGFDIPVRNSFVVELVNDRSHLTNAIALNSSLLHGARLVGPALSGIVIAKFGAGYCFLLDCLSFVAAIYALNSMSLLAWQPKVKKEDVWKKLSEGWQYVRDSLPIRSVLLLLILMSLIGNSYTTLLPIFAVEVLHGNSETLGFLSAASAVGAVSAGIFLARRKQNIQGLERFIAFAPIGLGAATILFSLSSNLVISLVCLGFAGFSAILQSASSSTIIQTMVEDDKRGRVTSFYVMSYMGMGPFSSLFAGTLAEWIGAIPTVILSGTCCALGALLFSRQIPQLQKWIQSHYSS